MFWIKRYLFSLNLLSNYTKKNNYIKMFLDKDLE